MVSPARRRDAVAYLVRRGRLSERRAYRLLEQHRSTQRYRPVTAEEELRLVARMNVLAARHPRVRPPLSGPRESEGPVSFESGLEWTLPRFRWHLNAEPAVSGLDVRGGELRGQARHERVGCRKPGRHRHHTSQLQRGRCPFATAKVLLKSFRTSSFGPPPASVLY